MKKSYPSATGKLLCVLLNPGDGELLTYVTSGQGEHCKKKKTEKKQDFLSCGLGMILKVPFYTKHPIMSELFTQQSRGGASRISLSPNTV